MYICTYFTNSAATYCTQLFGPWNTHSIRLPVDVLHVLYLLNLSGINILVFFRGFMINSCIEHHRCSTPCSALLPLLSAPLRSSPLLSSAPPYESTTPKAVCLSSSTTRLTPPRFDDALGPYQTRAALPRLQRPNFLHDLAKRNHHYYCIALR